MCCYSLKSCVAERAPFVTAANFGFGREFPAALSWVRVFGVSRCVCAPEDGRANADISLTSLQGIGALAGGAPVVL